MSNHEVEIVKRRLVEMPKASYERAGRGLRLVHPERMRFMLVYQAGIANVFRVDCFNLSPHGRNARRVYQGDFRGAEMLAVGAGLAGAEVMSSHCNLAGDIAQATWDADLDAAPFSDKFNPVFFTVGI